MRVLRVLLGVAIGGLMFVPLPAFAAEKSCHLEGDPATIVCVETGGGVHDGDAPVYTDPQPWTEHRYVPTCSANAPEGGADALCGAAVDTCTRPEIRYWDYTRTRYPDGRKPSPWKMGPAVCRGVDDPAEGGPPVITEQMLIDAATQAAPLTVVHVEPTTRSYVNVPNNFSVVSNPVTTNVQVLGLTIPITFTPTAYDWAFGDGAGGSGAGIRHARVGQAGAVEHAYSRSGDYDIRATRSFRVRATLPNGKVLTLDQPIRNTSAPLDLGVGEIQTVVTDVG